MRLPPRLAALGLGALLLGAGGGPVPGRRGEDAPAAEVVAAADLASDERDAADVAYGTTVRFATAPEGFTPPPHAVEGSGLLVSPDGAGRDDGPIRAPRRVGAHGDRALGSGGGRPVGTGAGGGARVVRASRGGAALADARPAALRGLRDDTSAAPSPRGRGRGGQRASRRPPRGPDREPRMGRPDGARRAPRTAPNVRRPRTGPGRDGRGVPRGRGRGRARRRGNAGVPRERALRGARAGGRRRPSGRGGGAGGARRRGGAVGRPARARWGSSTRSTWA